MTDKKNLHRKIIFVFSIFTLLNGQYTEKWRIDQDPSEAGGIMFDLNKDGVAELTKYLWNNITVYDGNNNYIVLWSVTDEDYEVLSLWNVYERNSGESDLAVFISSNYYDTLTTAVMGYEVLGSGPLWKTDELQGTYSYLVADDIDNDLALEIVLGLNTYDPADSSYSGRLYVIDGNTGDMEWVSSPIQGYITGPYVANIDNDTNKEMVLNVYDVKNESYYLSVWAYSGGTNSVYGETLPINEQPSNYPNPFNASTVIPFILDRNSTVTIDIVNLKGQRIKRLVNQMYPPGKFRIKWNGKNEQNQYVSSGLYMINMSIDGKRLTRPMVLNK